MRSTADKNLLDLILPKGVLEYFLLTDYTTGKDINLYLEEKNEIPLEYKNDKLTSKGFFDQITIQDFPLRGKAVYLHIKRRRWVNHTSGNIVFRDWNMVASGTRMTEEFASFLKGIPGYQAGKL